MLLLFAATTVDGQDHRSGLELESRKTATVRLAANIALLGVSGGLRHQRDQVSTRLWDVRAELLRLGVGAEIAERLGVCAGGVLVQVEPNEFSFKAVVARLFWDFDPDRQWQRRTAYASVTYHHDRYWGALGDLVPDEPCFEFGAGFAYTFYAVTPVAELRLSVGAREDPSVSLLAGVEVGGTYVLGSR